MNRLIFLGCLAGLFLFVGGCSSDGSGQKPVYRVSGTFTYQGKPMKDVLILLIPVDSQAEIPAASGETDDQGNFTLTTYRTGDGAAAGEFYVCIEKMIPKPGSKKELLGDDTPLMDFFGGKYGNGSTPLRHTVNAGANDPLKLDLK